MQEVNWLCRLLYDVHVGAVVHVRRRRLQQLNQLQWKPVQQPPIPQGSLTPQAFTTIIHNSTVHGK